MKIDFAKIAERNKLDETTLHLVVSGDKEFTKDSSLIMKVNGEDAMVSGMVVFSALIDRLVKKRIDDGFTIECRCGDNNGVDAIAEEWCKSKGFICKVHQAYWDKNGASAGYRRCEDMFIFMGGRPHKGCFLMWDGENKYTRYMMFCAWLQSVPCKVWNYIDKRWLSSNEVEEIQMDVRLEQLRHGRIV